MASAPQYLDESTADVIFLCKGATGALERIPAHRIVLVGALRGLTIRPREGREVIIDGVIAEEFTVYLKYLYDSHSKITYSNVAVIMKLARKYGDRLSTLICENFLVGILKIVRDKFFVEISPANRVNWWKKQLGDDSVVITQSHGEIFFFVWEMIVRFGHPNVNTQHPATFGLERKCKSIFKNVGHLLMGGTAFEKCHIDVLRSILSMKFDNRNEQKVFFNCMRWAKAACRKERMPTSPGNLKTVLAGCFDLIRFKQMKSGQFVKCLKSYADVFTRDELKSYSKAVHLNKKRTAACTNDYDREWSSDDASDMEWNEINTGNGSAVNGENSEIPRFSRPSMRNVYVVSPNGTCYLPTEPANDNVVDEANSPEEDIDVVEGESSNESLRSIDFKSEVFSDQETEVGSMHGDDTLPRGVLRSPIIKSEPVSDHE